MSQNGVPDGNELQKQAYAQKPIGLESVSVAVVASCLTMVGIATVILILRVYVRGWLLRASASWGWEDTFTVLAYCAFLTSSIFAVLSSYFGLGAKDEKLNPLLKIRATEYLLYCQVTYGVSMPLVKASLTFTLLRITNERKYRWSLYSVLFISTVMAIIGIVASSTYCTPVKAYWNPLLGKCGDFMRVVYIGYVWTAVGIVTDWFCAILPYFIVRKLQMSRRAKTTVLVILGVGSLASTATIVRAPYLQYYLATENQLYWNGFIIIWCEIESGLGLIAASLPALRKLFKTYFDGSRGGSKNTSGQDRSGSGALRTIGGSNKTKDLVKLEDLNAAGKSGQHSKFSRSRDWELLEDETSSERAFARGVHQDMEMAHSRKVH